MPNPNIKVYGYRDNEKERKRVSSEIATIIADSSLPYSVYNGLAITYIPSNCRSVSAVLHGLENEKQQFLRVCSTDMEELVAIATVLKEKGYEVEILYLDGFYEKRKP